MTCFFCFFFYDVPDTYSLDDTISIPVYTSSERDRIVVRMEVPCGGNKNLWLQCGAALFLKTQ